MLGCAGFEPGRVALPLSATLMHLRTPLPQALFNVCLFDVANALASHAKPGLHPAGPCKLSRSVLW
jgi:hypothetical protein